MRLASNSTPHRTTNRKAADMKLTPRNIRSERYKRIKEKIQRENALARRLRKRLSWRGWNWRADKSDPRNE